MTAKLLGVLLVGVLIGFGMTFLAKQPEAQAQKQEKPAADKLQEFRFKPRQWEFKVVAFPGTDAALGKAESELTKLAADGWEYVGLVNTPLSGLRADSWVAFKRPKKAN
jgi:hypothetical protein